MQRKVKPASVKKRPPGAARGALGARVMMHILKERPVFPSARKLAETLDAGHSQVADVVAFLTFHRALRETPEGWSVDWRQLARVMAALRLPDIVPRRTFATPIDMDALHRELQESEIGHAFGFTTAANLIAYFEPHPEVCLIIEEAQLNAFSRLARQDGLPEDEGPLFARIGPLARPPRGSARLLVFTDRLEKLDIVSTKTGPATSLHQTYVDLLQFPLAGAHADFLERAIEARWKREHDEPQKEA
jgi:hypothetical protein